MSILQQEGYLDALPIVLYRQKLFAPILDGYGNLRGPCT